MTSQNQPVFLRMTIRSIDDDNQVYFSNENESTQPIEVVPGSGHIFPKIDELLSSMEVGERKALTLSQDDAFGGVIEEAIQKVPLENLPEGLREPGAKVSAQTENNQTVQGTVIAVEDEGAVIDFNHPLAGKNVNVEFVVVEKP